LGALGHQAQFGNLSELGKGWAALVVAGLFKIVVDAAVCGARVVEQDVQGSTGGRHAEADVLAKDQAISIQSRTRSAFKGSLRLAAKHLSIQACHVTMLTPA
jgi:hypothetical protein